MTLKRRKFLQSLGLIFPMVTPSFSKILTEDKTVFLENKAIYDPFRQNFQDLNDRVWIGQSFWSVPMEDWGINKGRLEFSGIEKKSRLHLLTHLLNKGNGDFRLKSGLGLLEKKENGTVGFTVGIKDSTDEDSIKAACYYGEGISVGVSLDGHIFIAEETASMPATFNYQKFTLTLDVSTSEDKSEFLFIAEDDKNQRVELVYTYTGAIHGLVALENNIQQKDGSTFWWSNMELSGTKVLYQPKNSFGPVLWSMYTLSKSRLKLIAQLPPIGEKDPIEVELQLFQNGKWIKEKTNEIDPVSFTTVFEINNWEASLEIPYRLIYSLDNKNHHYEGAICREPVDRPLIFGGLTCQHWGGYPYRPLVENLEKCNPDILYFSGDQLYEANGGYPIKRQPEDKAILSYLGKWFMFGWAFGEVMRDRPTICTPDDHDVFQGNLWGDGGKRISFEDWEKVKDAHGGFVQTTKMVNVVNLTQCGHLPDPYDKAPLPSGMTTWYTNLNYGRVSFAIVSDRLFKSGPEAIRKGTGRIDHIKEPKNPQDLDSSKLSFFGKQQLSFLNDWVEDWQGVDMKVLLSQTLFSNVATHHGGQKEFMYGDMDSGGWPKSQRDEVIRIIRKACAFHINGDQHLPLLVQYSTEEPRDGGWTFCTPAISTGYPRWGQPDLMNMPFLDRPKHNLPNTGSYKDVFGNDNYVYAVGNPDDGFEEEDNRYNKCQKKSSGFGIVTFHKAERTIKMEAFRFLANLDVESEENHFPGWPLTIHQLENDGRKPLGYLPQIQLNKPNQVLKIINENSGELVQCIRIKGKNYVPSVYERSKYTLVIGEQPEEQVIHGIEITKNSNQIVKSLV